MVSSRMCLPVRPKTPPETDRAFNVSFDGGKCIEPRTIFDEIILKLIITLSGFKSIYIHARRYSMRHLARETARSRNRERPPTAPAHRIAGARDEDPQWTAERDRGSRMVTALRAPSCRRSFPVRPVVDREGPLHSPNSSPRRVEVRLLR